ncbi:MULTISPECIES: hypothetical protein [unclassified Streptomyces]|uniref:hypothetical protein n=1 Tax=unclassified Streptomyces TaxID=2593676 RepID=UPI000DB94610|nr:hypothetical protein [Streptomyces sp. PsTaAH-137]MYT70627.1 hypothetical protein [Streptomyces sp. SID8367]RAJ90329.1 hypothetical protein K377_00954 [Streptomyces sp. PsTaAH-137]
MSTEERTRDRSGRRRTLAVASALAAVLLAGGGGAYWATSVTGGDGGGSSDGSGAGGTPPPLALDGYGEGGAPGASNGIAPGEPDPNGSRYRATGDLPDGPDEAAVYRAKGSVTAADVQALGTALDVAGTPKLQAGTWRIGPAPDGSGPSLEVTGKAPGTWTYARYAGSASGKKCPGAASCAGGVGSGNARDAVSEAAAKKAAAPVLKALGQDSAKVDASQLMGATRVVNADPEVGGLPTYGWSTGIQIGSDGQVVGGSGRLKTPAEGATYPTVGAQETLKKMNGSSAGGRVPADACASAVPLDGGSGCTPSSPKPPASTTVDVTDAVFGLATYASGGEQMLVPSWLFTVEQPGAERPMTVTRPAVAPKYLVAPGSSTAAPEPSVSASASASGGPGSEVRDVPVQGYRADSSGTELTLHFTGGVCATYTAAADESGKQVTVRVTETQKKGTICVKVAKFYTLPVTLDAPLDGRKVVGTDGSTVSAAEKNRPGGAPAPRD